ncbi:MAG: hypothetical protein ACPLPW_08900 [bacterium]
MGSSPAQKTLSGQNASPAQGTLLEKSASSVGNNAFMRSQAATVEVSSSPAVQNASPEKSSSPTPSNGERPTREEIQNLLRMALKCGFVTFDKEGKKCVDYHHLGEFLKSSGFPPMIKEMNKEQCYMATLCLESRARYLYGKL